MWDKITHFIKKIAVKIVRDLEIECAFVRIPNGGVMRYEKFHTRLVIIKEAKTPRTLSKLTFQSRIHTLLEKSNHQGTQV